VIPRILAAFALVGSATLALSACTETAAPTATKDPRRLMVSATDTACTVSAASAPSGSLTFVVTNNGTQVNEFYFLGADGLKVIGEVEDIGPGLTRELVLSAPAGKAFTVCKPGMVGDGIRAEFTVSDSGATGPTG